MKQCFILKTGGGIKKKKLENFTVHWRIVMPILKNVNMKNEAKTWVHIEMGLNPKVATYFVQVTLETSVFPNCKMRAMATS